MTDIVDVDALEQRKNDLCLDADSYAFDTKDIEDWCDDTLTALRQQQEALKEKDEIIEEAKHAILIASKEKCAEIARLRAALARLIEVVETCEEHSYSDALEAGRKALAIA